MCNDSVIDPSRAPAGKAVMKMIVHNVPYDIRGDATGKIGARNWDEAKEPYADYLIDHLTETYAPTLKQNILKRVVHSPVDLERLMVSAVQSGVRSVHGDLQGRRRWRKSMAVWFSTKNRGDSDLRRGPFAGPLA